MALTVLTIVLVTFVAFFVLLCISAYFKATKPNSKMAKVFNKMTEMPAPLPLSPPKIDSPDSPIRCPKCGSTQVHTDKKGFSVLKAAGGALFIPGGVFWGLHGRNKIVITCLKCGKNWKV